MDLDPKVLGQLLDTPIAQPPTGVTATFGNTDSIGYQVYIAGTICIPLVLTFALLRFLARVKLKRTTSTGDDVVFVIGLVLSLACIIVVIYAVAGGILGRRAWNVRLGDFSKTQLLVSLTGKIMLPLSLCFVKLSLMMLFLRIFGIIKWMRVGCIFGIVAMAVFYVSVSIGFAAMCSPRTGTSQLDYLAANLSTRCNRTQVLSAIQGIGNFAFDLYILVLPLPPVIRLQIPWRRKLAVSSMFLIGICACVASIVSLVYRIRVFTSEVQDNVRDAIPVWVTSMAESTAGLIICCMPTIPAVFNSIQGPVRLWLSSVSRNLRFTSACCSKTTFSGSTTLPGDRLERHDTTESKNPINPHSDFSRVGSEGNVFAMQDLELGSKSGGKRSGI